MSRFPLREAPESGSGRFDEVNGTYRLEKAGSDRSVSGRHPSAVEPKTLSGSVRSRT